MKDRLKLLYVLTQCFVFLLAVGVPLMASAELKKTEEWVARYNGPGNDDDVASAIAVDPSGNVYVTGESRYGTDSDYTTVKYDTDGNQLWVARYDGPGNDDDVANAIAVDASGNVYVTGGSEGIGTRDDCATVKYDTNGNELWVARYNSPGNDWDYASAIAIDLLGNVYVAGDSEYNYLTVKYDSAGNELWAERYTSPGGGEDYVSAIAVDALGNVYVTGGTNIYLTGSGDGNGTDANYLTVKYDSAGNELWATRYNGPGNDDDVANAIAVDASGNIYVTGRSEGIGTCDDYATVKYDPDGNQLWVARYSGPENRSDGASAAVVDAWGNIYVTGGSEGIGTRDDYATVKYDTEGNQLWVARYSGPENRPDGASAIVVDSSGNIYVTGKSSSSVTNKEYATVKYDPDGNQLWVARYDGPGNNYDRPSIALDLSGNVYVTGQSQGDETGLDYATLKYKGVDPTEVTMGLPAGWSMISLPVKPEVATVEALFPAAVVVYKYQKGMGYVRVREGENLEVGMGYWILLDSAQSYLIRGTEIMEYTIPVVDGWYMIGGCSLLAQRMVTSGNIDVIYEYTPGFGYTRIPASQLLVPAQGYWILFSNTSEGGVFWATAREGLPSGSLIVGTIGNDILYGNEEDNIMQGFAGHDRLYGGEGDDTLDGGPGDDYLSGGAGNDTYCFEHGLDQDTICDYDTTAGNIDKIKFAEGVTPEDIEVSRDLYSLYLTIADTGQRLTVRNYFALDGYRVEYIEFSDGTVWDVPLIRQMVLPVATEDADALYGTPYRDIVDALGGDDLVHLFGGDDVATGGEGNDELHGDEGDDNLYGDEGHDTMYGGMGEDTLEGGVGADSLYGGAGHDSLSGGEGDDQLYGGPGEDRLHGGAGFDMLEGSYGNDIYLFERGAGHDVICDYDITVGNIDTIQFTDDITPADIKVTRDMDHLYLTIVDATGGSTGDQITVMNWFFGKVCWVEQVVFADGTVWEADGIVHPFPTEESNRWYGTSGDDVIQGFGGNDIIYGLGGNDILMGRDGNDTLYGGPDDDVLDGGPGDDMLSGDAGNDTYFFGRGSGQDTIYKGDGTPGDIDRVLMEEGVWPEDLLISRDIYNLYVVISDTGDQLTVHDFFADDGFCIERVEFGDGTVWDPFILHEMSRYVVGTGEADTLYGYEPADVIEGLGGDDTLYGRDGNDTLSGGEGDDHLYGESGEDRLHGGVGFDMLEGSYGNDIYLFERGAGHDVICDYDITAGNIDTIQFADGIAKEDIAIFQNGSNLQIDYGNGDIVTIQNQSDSAHTIEQVETNDGYYLTNEDINTIIQDMTAFANDNGIPFSNVDDVKGNEELMNIVSNGWKYNGS